MRRPFAPSGSLPRAGFLVLALCLAAPLPAAAGAWTQRKGDGQAIVTARTYSTGTRFDDNGRKRSQRRYSAQNINPYLEYGLTDRLTLGANLLATRADDGTNARIALSDSEFFARARLWQEENWVVSLQPTLTLPGPQSGTKRRPAIGSKSGAAGAQLLAGYGFPLLGGQHFSEAGIGYRHRMGNPGDQLTASATLGFALTPDLTLMPQLFQTVRLKAPAAASFTESPRDDYTLTVLQLSALYRLDEKNALQLGGFAHVAGENAGAGRGLLLSAWRNF